MIECYLSGIVNDLSTTPTQIENFIVKEAQS